MISTILYIILAVAVCLGFNVLGYTAGRVGSKTRERKVFEEAYLKGYKDAYGEGYVEGYADCHWKNWRKNMRSTIVSRLQEKNKIRAS